MSNAILCPDFSMPEAKSPCTYKLTLLENGASWIRTVVGESRGTLAGSIAFAS